MYIMHIMSPQLQKRMKAPPGHYKEHTSRSILDIRGLASHRNQDAQPMDVINRRVATIIALTLLLLLCPLVLFSSL
jgi:hypothetical protein